MVTSHCYRQKTYWYWPFPLLSMVGNFRHLQMICRQSPRMSVWRIRIPLSSWWRNDAVATWWFRTPPREMKWKMKVQGTRDLQERFTGEIYRVRFTCKRIMVLIVVLFSSLSRMSYIFEYICNCAKFDLRRSIVLVFAETSRLSYILKYICNRAKFVSSLGCLFVLFNLGSQTHVT